ncbi:hypothetical protein HPB52_016307 [Rhipicephalus sanguineus]|uniref:Tick transposon n=1 Tax=Rhipicephalus sanguineus TaxID=34632 RepID=A0A9D4T5S5_RHISA|nr:hypothetical protein HPB52_016307 [Rhipicephalus sanguineus]
MARRLYERDATVVQFHALPLMQLAPQRKEHLERQQRKAVRCFMGLPRQSPMAAVQVWLLSPLMLRQALHRMDRLHRALPSFGGCGAGQLHGWDSSALSTKKWCPRLPVLYSPVHRPSGLWTCSWQPQHTANTGVRAPTVSHGKNSRQDAEASPDVHGRVCPGQPHSAATACVIPMTGTITRCRLPFHASSTAAEVAGFHLAASYFAATTAQLPVAILCDSRPALQALLPPDLAGITVALLHANDDTKLKYAEIRQRSHIFKNEQTCNSGADSYAL